MEVVAMDPSVTETQIAHVHVRSLRRALVPRLARNGLIVLGLVAIAVGVGALGYHYFAGLLWLMPRSTRP